MVLASTHFESADLVTPHRKDAWLYDDTKPLRDHDILLGSMDRWVKTGEMSIRNVVETRRSSSSETCSSRLAFRASLPSNSSIVVKNLKKKNPSLQEPLRWADGYAQAPVKLLWKPRKPMPEKKPPSAVTRQPLRIRKRKITRRPS